MRPLLTRNSCIMEPKFLCQIIGLPTEVIISTCQYLEPPDLYYLSLTASSFYGLATEELLRRAVGANVTKNGRPLTILQWAALNGQYKLAQKLLDLGADFHVRGLRLLRKHSHRFYSAGRP